MTALDLQKELAAEIREILRDVTMPDMETDRPTADIKVFRQFIPKTLEDDEDITETFPYAIVRLMDGSTPNADPPWLVTVDVLLGSFDRNPDMSGNDHIMVMIQRIINRFDQEPLLAKKYRCTPEMEWSVQDEDTYPFFFGSLRLIFEVPKIPRRDHYYG